MSDMDFSLETISRGSTIPAVSPFVAFSSAFHLLLFLLPLLLQVLLFLLVLLLQLLDPVLELLPVVLGQDPELFELGRVKTQETVPGDARVQEPRYVHLHAECQQPVADLFLGPQLYRAVGPAVL